VIAQILREDWFFRPPGLEEILLELVTHS
jgi:hypothetical protein